MHAADLDGLNWRKSSYSGGTSGNCVAMARTPDAMAVRDSKHPDGPILIFAAAAWRAFQECPGR